MFNLNQSKFNQIAQNYDNDERIKLAEIISLEVNTLLENQPYQSLLDYGGGTGLVTFNIEHHFNHITILDASTKMVEICDTKIQKLSKKHIEAIKGDALASNQTIVDQSYDVIILSLVLLHSGNYKELLQRLTAYLKKDGLIIIVDFDKNKNVYHPKVYNGFAQDDISSELFKLGLSNIKVQTFYHGQNIFMNKDASLFIASGQFK